jgi:hypothetical protein
VPCKGVTLSPQIMSASCGYSSSWPSRRTTKGPVVLPFDGRTRVVRYNAMVQRWLRLRLLLVHLTNRPPPRNTKLLSVQHRNTANNDVHKPSTTKGHVLQASFRDNEAIRAQELDNTNKTAVFPTNASSVQ